MLVFSVLQPLEDAVRWLLDRFHYNLHLPWAWSIVATTVVVRILLVPLTVKQIHSMQVMQRHAPALKELQKKSKADSHWSGFLLLAIYAISQVISTWFMSTTMDKTQRAIMLVLPLIFISVVAHFPAGLVLYWVTTNLWTVGQGLITRRLIPKTPAPALPRRTSRTAPRGDVDEDGGDGGGDGA